ncbi:hypothetical protein [Nonomuraea sp. NPDC046570]|uniref:hypothetical protein n=1 Tax=Nonomuraea sp. NPDC046570 TaxID=3155255 RepID=UPI0033E157A5
MLEQTLEEARSTQAELAAIEDPHARLEAVLRYFLPLDEDGLAIEKARVALVSHRGVEPAIELHLSLIGPGMRDLVRTAIRDFTGTYQLDATVDLIRLWTSGVVLSTIEHPELLDRRAAEQGAPALHEAHRPSGRRPLRARRMQRPRRTTAAITR